MEDKYRDMSPKKYRELVDNITKSNLKYYGSEVDEGLTVDHIFPVSVSRAMGLPPELVADMRNLQFIPLKENIRKGYKCNTIPLFIQHYILEVSRDIVILTRKQKIKRGIDRAKNKGVYKGRKVGSTETIEQFLEKPKIKEIVKLLKDGGITNVEISRRVGVHHNTVTKVRKYLKLNGTGD